MKTSSYWVQLLFVIPSYFVAISKIIIVIPIVIIGLCNTLIAKIKDY